MIKKLHTLNLTLGALTAALVLSGCQDEDFGYDSKTIEFETNFKHQFGDIPSDQSWDLSSMPRTSSYEPWSHSDATRAIPGIDTGEASAIIVTGNGDDWYSVQQETLDWMHNNLVEGRNNTTAGEAFSLLPPTQNDFAIIPIYIGQHKMDWSLHLVSGGKDYEVWSEWKDGYSQGIQIKADENANWTNVASNDNTLNAYAVQGKPVRINHEVITTEFFFYLSIDKGHMQGMSYEYADGNYAKTGTAQRSDCGMMLALNCPIPANIGLTGKDQNEVMIISCEDSNESDSDYDMNDLVFLVVGYPNIPDLIEYTRKRYMCEDLGNTYDFDFNDVVIDVDQSIVKRAKLNSTSTWVEFIEDPSSLKQYATVKHLCGTLPFRIKVGGYEFNPVSDPTDHATTLTELEGGTRADVTETVESTSGVDWNPEVSKEITGWDPTTNNVYLTVSNKVNPLQYVFTDKFGTEVVEEDGENFLYIINFPEAGKTPMIVCVDQTVNWMDENVHIPETWWKTGEVFYKTIKLTSDPAEAGSFTGDGSYPNGSKVVITARPNDGYVFDHWSDANTENPRTFNALNSNIELTAHFRQRQQVKVNWNYDGIEASDVTLSATINGEAQTSGTTYYEGTKIHFTATSTNPSKELAAWKVDDNILSTNASFDYTVSSTYGNNITVKAHFAAPWWDVAVPDGVIWSGEQSLNGYTQFNDISDYNGDNQPSYHEANGSYRSEYQRLIKSLKTGCRYLLFEFENAINNGSMTVRAANWGEIANIQGISKSYVLVTLTDDKANQIINNNGMRIEFNLTGKLTTVKALSEAPDFLLNVNVSATEGGTATSSKSKVDLGESVTLTATPAADKVFKGWKTAVSDANFASTENPWTFKATESVSYVAIFGDPAQFSVNISAGANGKVTISGTDYTSGNSYNATIAEDTELTITATATTEGYRFKEWSDGEKSATRTIKVKNNVTLSASFEEGPAGPTVLFEGEQSTADCQQVIAPKDTEAFYAGATVKIYFSGGWLNVHYGQWNQQPGWDGNPRTKVLTADDVSTIKSRGLWAHGDGNVTKVTIE